MIDMFVSLSARCVSLSTFRDGWSEWNITRQVVADDDPVEQASTHESLEELKSAVGSESVVALLLYEELGGIFLAKALHTTAGAVRVGMVRARRKGKPVPTAWHPTLKRLWDQRAVAA